MSTIRRLSAVGIMVLSSVSASVFAAEELTFTRQTFEIPAEIEEIIVADTNGDQLNDLIAVFEDKLRLYFQSADGFNFESGFEDLVFPGDSVGWDISNDYSENGSSSIIALVDGSEVLVWNMESNSIKPPLTVKSELPGFLSKGINRLYFSRDINGDGAADLVIPGAGVLILFINNTDGSYQSGLSIQSDTNIRTNLEANTLERRVGQAIRIPLMNLRDVNSDGFDDLVARTLEKLDVFIADDSAERYFPLEPSYSLDIAEIEARLGEFDIDDLDFSNLTGLLSLTHEETLEDVDGDGNDDLLLREGGKVSLFMGTNTGMDLEQPRQVLRSGGNVLSTFLYDENEDDLNDLWLWRVESISVGDIFVWLALSGSVAVEAFIYPNDGERFARRPTRKISVTIKFPSALRLFNTFQDFENEAEEYRSTASIPTARGELDPIANAEELLVLIENRLDIFLNSIETEESDDDFLGALEYSRQKDDYEINLREIIDNISISGNPDLARVSNQSADLSIQIGTDTPQGDVISVKLNSDSLDDVIIFTEQDDSHIRGLLLLSN